MWRKNDGATRYFSDSDSLFGSVGIQYAEIDIEFSGSCCLLCLLLTFRQDSLKKWCLLFPILSCLQVLRHTAWDFYVPNLSAENRKSKTTTLAGHSYFTYTPILSGCQGRRGNFFCCVKATFFVGSPLVGGPTSSFPSMLSPPWTLRCLVSRYF